MKTLQEKIRWGIVAVIWVVSIVAYRIVPGQLATHWNAQGVANGYSGRIMGLFLIPMILIAVQLVFMAIPYIDPLKENIEKFKKQFDGFATLITLFMAYLFGITLAWNLGSRFSMNVAIATAFGMLFFGIGILLKGVRRNWFIGIRTPWTLSSDEVWDRTHEVGSVVFKVIGALALLGLVFPRYAIAYMLVPALAGAIGIVVYSYVVFQKEK